MAYTLWLLAVIVFDFRQRRVPNWLVLAGAVMALAALGTGTGLPGVSWTAALAAGALAFGVMLVFYATGLMGAGDVKFAGALGLWAGLPALLPVWIISSLLAAAHGLVWMALQRWPVWPRLALALSAPLAATATASGSTSGIASGIASGSGDGDNEHRIEAGAGASAVPQRRARPRHVPYAAYMAIAALMCMASTPL